jgi:hypothetical protein
MSHECREDNHRVAGNFSLALKPSPDCAALDVKHVRKLSVAHLNRLQGGPEFKTIGHDRSLFGVVVVAYGSKSK